jgi:hypothetical protein
VLKCGLPVLAGGGADVGSVERSTVNQVCLDMFNYKTVTCTVLKGYAVHTYAYLHRLQHDTHG